MTEEKEKWQRMVNDLQQKYSLETIAQEIGVTARQVSNIKAGDRPKGFVAIRLYLFHVKHGTKVQDDGTTVHSSGRI